MSNNGDQELKIYEVTLRATGEKSYQAAKNAEDACKQAGWLIGDCFFVAPKSQRKARGDNHSALMVKMPCRTCPFQYGECKKPAKEECPVRPNAPELKEWMKQACEAHKCDHYGQELSETDYHLNQKWLPMAQAIEELGDHH